MPIIYREQTQNLVEQAYEDGRYDGKLEFFKYLFSYCEHKKIRAHCITCIGEITKELGGN